MQSDRQETNLGPDIPPELEAEVAAPAQRQPKKRFIGRRTAEQLAAARAADQSSDSNSAADNGSSNIEDVGAVQAPRPTRTPRLLNRVPDDILHDDDINAAITLLPSNYSFEIHKTIHRIRTAGSRKVALQFPEGLLLFATTISDILTRFCPGIETLIMGDVTYGACCIDDFTARAVGCDLLVHYGHSCLVPVDVTSVKTLYVFVTIGIAVDHLLATISTNFRPASRIALVGTIQFNSTLHAIVPKLKAMGYDAFLPRSAPLSAGEILGCTAPSLSASNRTVSTDHPSNGAGQVDGQTADMILYVGDGRFHLESILIASPALRNHTYRYDPYSRRLTHETYAHAEMHALRSQAIRTAQQSLTPPKSPESKPRTWGIILGTLGRQGNPHTVSLIKAQLDARGIPHMTLLLSEIFPAKLAQMSADVAIWVQVACPRLSIDWGYAFPRPLLSPYEALVALDVRDGAGWRVEVDAGELEVEVDLKQEMSQVQARQEKEKPLGLYPMDFYAKSGLGRTRADDVPVH